MKTTLLVLVTIITLISFVYAYGGKTVNERSSGAKITAAGLIALGLIAVTY